MTFETVPRVFKGRGERREALPREVRLGRAGRGEERGRDEEGDK